MCNNVFARCFTDHCCYTLAMGVGTMILLLYIDDMLIAGPEMEVIEKLKERLVKSFEMKDLGRVRKILGMMIERD